MPAPGTCAATEPPEPVPGSRGPSHLKRCHLADSNSIYEAEVLPEIAPDLLKLIVNEQAAFGSGTDDTAPAGR